MTDIEIIKRVIDELEKRASKIGNLGAQLLDEVELFQDLDPDNIEMGITHFYWGKSLKPELKSIQRETIRNYQIFFSTGLHLVKEYLPEKQDEFTSCYESKSYEDISGIMDYLQLRQVQHTNQKDEIIEHFEDRFEIQRSIIASIPYIVKIKEMNLRELISAVFIEREIEEAEYLFKNNHVRAACALAGVALEQHLKTQCDKFQIEYKKMDTIEPLVQKLYKKDKIDITQMKNIQYLASIRNKCDHPSEIEKEEVKGLIERVKKLPKF